MLGILPFPEAARKVPILHSRPRCGVRSVHPRKSAVCRFGGRGPESYELSSVPGTQAWRQIQTPDLSCHPIRHKKAQENTP